MRYLPTEPPEQYSADFPDNFSKATITSQIYQGKNINMIKQQLFSWKVGLMEQVGPQKSDKEYGVASKQNT
jgi:hypothetical protein